MHPGMACLHATLITGTSAWVIQPSNAYNDGMPLRVQHHNRLVRRCYLVEPLVGGGEVCSEGVRHVGWFRSCSSWQQGQCLRHGAGWSARQGEARSFGGQGGSGLQRGRGWWCCSRWVASLASGGCSLDCWAEGCACLQGCDRLASSRARGEGLGGCRAPLGSGGCVGTGLGRSGWGLPGGKGGWCRPVEQAGGSQRGGGCCWLHCCGSGHSRCWCFAQQRRGTLQPRTQQAALGLVWQLAGRLLAVLAGWCPEQAPGGQTGPELPSRDPLARRTT
jgi:hypothetical protein